MEDLNIFKCIRKATRRIEPFHSQFLADALKVSRNRDRSLFDEIRKLVAPSGWDVPDDPEIKSEDRDAESGRRIDITIRDKSRSRVVGIEVKTSDSSAEADQLETYQQDLERNNTGSDIAIAYLTPFNRECAGDKAGQLKAVQVFEVFEKSSGKNAKHLSWRDVAEIPWNGNDLWKQHQQYLLKCVSSEKKLKVTTSRDRSLDVFFGADVVESFWYALANLGIRSSDGGTTIDLEDIKGDPDSLAKAFKVLIDSENVSRGAKRNDTFPLELREHFLKSSHGGFHKALFDLSDRYPYLKLRGKKNYALVVACKKFRDVSLVTSKSPDRIEIGRRR